MISLRSAVDSIYLQNSAASYHLGQSCDTSLKMHENYNLRPAVGTFN